MLKHYFFLSTFFSMGMLFWPTPGAAQQSLTFDEVEIFVDSGISHNRQAARSVIFSETISVPGATWLRLYFDEATLGPIDDSGQDGGEQTVLRITSLLDGAVQIHTTESLAQWKRSSAYFNGDSITVELISDPAAAPSRIRIRELDAGRPDPAAMAKTICGAMDDRTLSTDDRVGRVVPVGCTAWMIDDSESCFLTAGHCEGGMGVVQFNVPLSNADGSINHPGPEDQYPVDDASIQFSDGGIGNDYLYFGAHPNGQTLLTPFEAQGQTFVLGTPPLTAGGETLRITGYGTVDGNQGTPQTWSQVQHTHSGLITSASASRLQYAVDTTGGDSGSPVINELTGEAIGIHTHAGCSQAGGANNGTSLNLAALQTVLANPMGVCTDGVRPLRVFLNTPLPINMSPNGMQLEISVTDRNDQPVALSSASLIYDDGNGEQTISMTANAPLDGGGIGTYVGSLPSLTCGGEVTFRFEAEALNGTVVHHPFSADNTAGNTYRRPVAIGFDETFRDSFEIDQGWTVDDDPGLGAGTWERGIPAGYGRRGDPPWDADSSGSAFLTYNSGGNTDVDGGASRLTSPTLDAGGSDAHIHYWRWWDDAGASDDTFTVEVSDDDGSTWTVLETVGPNVLGEWVYRSFRIADFVTPNASFKIRFTASDLATGDVIEAAVDGVSLSNGSTGLLCSDNIFSDGFETGDTSVWSNTNP